jgi:putative nucleotide binding protein
MFLKDENCIVLDFLQRGHATGRREPLAQVMGDKYFSLLEVVVRKDVVLKHGDAVYIGKDERKEIDHIKRRINVNDLTTFAKSELKFVVEKVVDENEEKFVNFFNNARAITTRMHQLELLPGIGKKHMWDIINERKKGTFKSWKDIQERVKLLPDPKGMIIKRIMEELENPNERFRLFVSGPTRRF